MPESHPCLLIIMCANHAQSMDYLSHGLNGCICVLRSLCSIADQDLACYKCCQVIQTGDRNFWGFFFLVSDLCLEQYQNFTVKPPYAWTGCTFCLLGSLLLVLHGLSLVLLNFIITWSQSLYLTAVPLGLLETIPYHWNHKSHIIIQDCIIYFPRY